MNSLLDKEMAMRLLSLVSHLHRPVVCILLAYIDPGQQLLRDSQFFALLRQKQSK